MNFRLLFLLIIFSKCVEICLSLKIDGRWSNDDQFYSVVAKFGFQKTDPYQLNRTRGYIFGNITSDGTLGSSLKATLVLANRPHFRQMYEILTASDSDSEAKCARVMLIVAQMAFDSRCYPNGNQDILRMVPCPKGNLCDEEDDPTMVFKGNQLTYRVQDKAQARFWYLLIIDCHLDSACNWTRTNGSVTVNYFLSLVNGHPDDHSRYNPFEYQFSCEEQDLFEIIATALLVTLILLGLQCRAARMKKNSRSFYLLLVLCLQMVELCSFLFHLAVFASNGKGIFWIRDFASFVRHLVDACLILLLVLMAKGWTIRSNVVKQRSKTFFTWIGFLVFHFGFYIWAVSSIDELQDMYIFDTWPGWGILLVRVLTMGWFLVELRYSVRQVDERKQGFFLHFGSGFLVWFVYLPILGAISSKIPVMYRYKVTTSLSYLANFVACAILIHLFYPRSTNRSYFLGAYTNANEEFDDEYEKAIIMEDLDSIEDISDKSLHNDRNGDLQA